ncbi:hypothetical protein Pelo_6566 [Pelomyxa schiedti]|nr:hypothetical protein Pelo_6566 [Pelomyxa schiedti]
MQVMDILKDPELLPYFVFGCLPPNSIGILTGMHLCGPLSKSFIHCFSVVEQIASMILCPCCLESHKKSGIAAEARSLNVDNYLHWTSHLLQSLPQESLRTTCIQDEHILTIKNKIITATRLKLTFNPTPLSSLLSSIQQTESTKPPKQKAVCLYKLASEDPDFQGASAVIAKRFTWCAIDGCPGRYTLSPGQITGSDGISALVTAAGLDPKITVQPEVVGSSIRARDPVTTAAFINTTPDSTASASTQSNNSYGGFISYRHSNGSYLHTLCTASGFARKKNQLGL